MVRNAGFRALHEHVPTEGKVKNASIRFLPKPFTLSDLAGKVPAK